MTLFHSMEWGLAVIPYLLWMLCLSTLSSFAPLQKISLQRQDGSVCMSPVDKTLQLSFTVYSEASMLPSLVNGYEIYLLIELEDIWFWYWFIFKKIFQLTTYVACQVVLIPSLEANISRKVLPTRSFSGLRIYFHCPLYNC